MDCSRASACDVLCLSYQSCRNDITCGPGTCNIQCRGESSCWQGRLTCGKGKCLIDCGGPAREKDCKTNRRDPLASNCGYTCSSMPSCGESSSCQIQCRGNRSCRSGATCGKGNCDIYCSGENSCWQGVLDCKGAKRCGVCCTGAESCRMYSSLSRMLPGTRCKPLTPSDYGRCKHE